MIESMIANHRGQQVLNVTGAVMRAAFVNARSFAKHLVNRFRQLRGVGLLLRILRRTFGRNISQVSAGIAYFAILSLFPLLILAVSIASIFFDPGYVTEQLRAFLGEYLPASSGFVENNISNVLQLRGPVGIASFAMLVMSGSGLFASLGRVANSVLGIQRRRPFYTEKLMHLGMMAISGGLVIASILATVLVQVAASVEIDSLGGLEGLRGAAVQAGTYIVAFAFTILMFLVIYRFLPNAVLPWRQVLAGAIVASVLFELSKLVFIFYMRNFSNPELVYGSLGSAVALLLWCYISAHIFVIGAAVSAESGSDSRRAGGSENHPFA